jgi:copper homeostasis protein
MFKFEICANSVKSCVAAQEGGANRVELCAAIPEGGTTPSFGEIITTRKLLHSTLLHVIIRPRAGDFLYAEYEIQSMLQDIELCHQIGVDGVVFGCLTAEGEVDKPLMRQLINAAKDMSVTFHRAFDMTSDPFKALEDCIELGCARILTSGQQAKADEGLDLLYQLKQQAAGRIILLAGSGVNPSNIKRIHEKTGITEFHFSARELLQSQMQFRNPTVSMGGTIHIDEYQQPFTTKEKVRECISALVF